MSSAMAWRAASLISSGAAKSGKPWERLTALCCNARRVISRMTDSVNCSALAESMRRAMCVMLGSGVDMGIVFGLGLLRLGKEKSTGEIGKVKAEKRAGRGQFPVMRLAENSLKVRPSYRISFGHL